MRARPRRRTSARLAANGPSSPASTGTAALPLPVISTLPSQGLWVRQQSHDRNIHDISLFNQTELTAKFDTGAISHTLLLGAELAHESYCNQDYYRNGTCNGIPLNPSGNQRATSAARRC